MKIADFAIKRPVTITMLVVCVLVLGFASVAGLPMELTPDISMPIAVVMTTYDGAGPEEIENLITRPLESVLATVSDCKEITSTSSSGSSMVLVQFTQGTDMDFAALNMREKVDLIKGTLPDGASTPTIMQFDPSMMPMGMYAVMSENDTDLAELKTDVENDVQSRLERLNGVAEASLLGGLEREISIELSPELMQAYGLSSVQVRSALASENITMPGGTIDEGGYTYTLRTEAEYQSVEEIGSVIIASPTGNVYLRDIAEITDGYADAANLMYLDGQPCVALQVQKQSDANTVEVSDLVNEELERIREVHPEYHIITAFDQADYIRDAVSSVLESAILGGILAVIILLLFLGNLRTTMVVALSIPISLVATFGCMYLADVSINLMSLGGLTLGVGMLVDNSIVVLESIYRYRVLGYDKKESASKGASEVTGAIIASTLTTVVVFLPIVIIRDNIAIELFREMALTVTFSLVCSLVVALTVVPLLSSRLVDTKLLGGKKNFIMVAMDHLKEILQTAVKWALAHRKLIVFGSFGVLVVTVGLMLGLLGFEFMPSEDQSSVTISVSLPEGATLEDTSAINGEVTAAIGRIGETLAEPDFVMVQESAGSGSFTLDYSKAKKSGVKMADIVEELRRESSMIAGAEITTTQAESMSMSMTGGGPINIEISGDDWDKLAEITEEAKDKLMQIEGIRDVTSSIDAKKPEITVSVNRAAAAAYGVSASGIASAVQGAVMGQTATQYRVDGNEIDVTIRYRDDATDSIAKLRELSIPTNTGAYLPLSALADIEIIEAPTSISRSNQTRYTTVNASISGGKNLSRMMREVENTVISMPVEEGYHLKLAGENEDINDMLSGFSLVILLAVFLVYLVMACQFEKFTQPFIIMMSIPLAMIGVAVAGILFWTPLSVVSMIGIVVLVGIVVNNAIVLVDYINQLRSEQQMSLYDAILEAVSVRLRPIMMTTLTTVLGMVPMAIGLGEGSEMMAPLAIAVIGGLVFSTMLTLIFIPVTYSILDEKLEKRKRKRSAKKEEAVQL